MDRIRLLCIVLLLAMGSACATHMPPDADRINPMQTAKADEEATKDGKNIIQELFTSKPAKDEQLFLYGLSLLSETMQKDDFRAAKDSFETLINGYPESKWRNAASAILSLIRETELYRDKIRLAETSVNKISADKQRVTQEIDQMKKELRLLNEKSQTEITALQQENEQLKKDLQLLKDLEIQLEKREKSLR